jgi:hypothetical protein
MEAVITVLRVLFKFMMQTKLATDAVLIAVEKKGRWRVLEVQSGSASEKSLLAD